MASPAQLLVVSPDGTVREAAQRCLLSLGHFATLANSVERARRALTRVDVDAMCLDTLLPCDQLERLWLWLAENASRPSPPVVLLAPESAQLVPSALPAFFQAERHGLVSKPIEMAALAGEVTRVLAGRPRRARSSEMVRAGSVTLDVATNQLLFDDGGTLSLTPMEAKLLSYLMQQAGEFIPPEELLREVWGYPEGSGGAEVVRAHVSNVRRKLRTFGADPQILRTMPYQGYGFVPDVPDFLSN